MILSVSADSKTVKGEKLGYLTGILYLAPYNLSGTNLCPNADNAQCHKACLYSAGRGAFNNVQQARLNKTERFNNDLDNFMLDLVWSIEKVIRKAKRGGLTPVIRLNGTSDIDWQTIPVANKNNIFNVFPLVQFYDYTKQPRKSKSNNYHLTFSYSGVKSYAKTVEKALRLGINMAVVFRKELPLYFMGLRVIDGDESDLRFLDKRDDTGQAVIVGLKAKGKARKDYTGFVVDPGEGTLKWVDKAEQNRIKLIAA